VTPLPTPSAGPARAEGEAKRRSFAGWVLIGVPALLGLLFIWQIASGYMHAETIDHAPVAIATVRLEADPAGTRVDVVLVDRQGADASAAGDVSIKLREPDGAVWQSTRAVSPEEFAPLPAGHLSAGRVGYSLLVPAADWVRAPRRGGSASVSVSFQPRDDGAAPITRQAEERFP
jgi:hypothetical protein